MYAMKFMILFLFVSAIKIDTIEGKLKYVFNIFRHGASSPRHQVKNFKDSLGIKWGGDSELTQRGIRQQFLFGQKMRLRYINDLKFISSSFEPEEVEILSTNTNKTISSTYSYLTGLFPPMTGPYLRDNQLQWARPTLESPDQNKILRELKYAVLPFFSEVYPIQIFSTRDQFFSLQESEMCKGIGPIVENNKKTRNITLSKVKFNSKFGNVKKILNYTDDYFFDYDNIKLFCDAFVSATFDRRDMTFLKLNLTDLDLDCKAFMKTDLFDVSLRSDNDFIPKMAMTPVMNNFILFYDLLISIDNKKFTGKIEESPLLTLYSGHDSNIATFLEFLNIVFKINLKYDYVPFAASLLMEFHVLDNAPTITNDSHYYLLIFYNGDLIKKVTYKDFKAVVKPNLVFVSSIDDFCGFVDNSGLYFMIAIGCLACTAMGLGIWILLLLCKIKPIEAPLLPQ